MAGPPPTPFAPVPGTVTAWLLTKTAGQSEGELEAKLLDAEDPYHHLDNNNPDFAPIAQQILSAQGLLCFLTARSTEGGPVVSLVHSFGQYSQGFAGRAGRARAYGLMGETLDG